MACTGQPMGFYQTVFGGDGTTYAALDLKKKFQWQLKINNITSSATADAEPLPCIRASRPKLNFREMTAEHLNETITYPAKPEWQPIQLTLYDRCLDSQNPIWTWITGGAGGDSGLTGGTGGAGGDSGLTGGQYDPSEIGCSDWFPCIDPLSFKPCANLELYDGCGNLIEAWTLEHCWPQNTDFGELNMDESAVVTADVTLKYDRAWQTYPSRPHTLYDQITDTVCTTCTDATCDSSISGLSTNSVDDSSSSMMQAIEIEIEPDFVMF